jgi:hypothetical protein
LDEVQTQQGRTREEGERAELLGPGPGVTVGRVEALVVLNPADETLGRGEGGELDVVLEQLRRRLCEHDVVALRE